MAKKDKKKFVKKDLECQECGAIRQVLRFAARNRQAGHNKPLFCAVCKKDTIHEEM